MIDLLSRVIWYIGRVNNRYYSPVIDGYEFESCELSVYTRILIILSYKSFIYERRYVKLLKCGKSFEQNIY